MKLGVTFTAGVNVERNANRLDQHFPHQHANKHMFFETNMTFPELYADEPRDEQHSSGFAVRHEAPQSPCSVSRTAPKPTRADQQFRTVPSEEVGVLGASVISWMSI